MFQSLAGTDDCNKTFDVTVEKILNYAKSKKGKRYGLYFETGQGSEFTNGAANGVDMMVLESRKYGFSRAVQMELAKVQPKGRGSISMMWPDSSGPRSSGPASSWCGAAWKISPWASSTG